jgi:hypothetical protein
MAKDVGVGFQVLKAKAPSHYSIPAKFSLLSRSGPTEPPGSKIDRSCAPFRPLDLSAALEVLQQPRLNAGQMESHAPANVRHVRPSKRF